MVGSAIAAMIGVAAIFGVGHLDIHPPPGLWLKELYVLALAAASLRLASHLGRPGVDARGAAAMLLLVLAIGGEDGADLAQGGIGGGVERGVGEAFHEFAADEERGRLLGGEGDRGKMVAMDECVADTGLAGDGHARFAEGGDIAVDRAQADFEVCGEILGADEAPALQEEHDGDEAVGAVHRGGFARRSIDGCRGFGYGALRAGWSSVRREACAAVAADRVKCL